MTNNELLWMLRNNCGVSEAAVNAAHQAADRIEALEAKLAKAVDVIDWALICWDDHNKHGYTMQGDWVSDARTTLAELKGEADAT